MARLFIALELSESTRTQLTQFQKEIRSILKTVSWVKPGSMHLTLKFLGEVPEEQIPAIGEALDKSLEGISAFDLEVRGSGVFPNWSGPRVLWAGIAQGEPAVKTMAERIKNGMEPLGFKKEPYPFVPHLTLGRVKGRLGGEKERAEKIFWEKKGLHFGIQHVSEVILMQSTLTPQGAVYKKIKNRRLKE